VDGGDVSASVVTEVVRLTAAVSGVVLLGAAVTKVDAAAGWTGLVARFPVEPRIRRLIVLGVPTAELVVGTAVVLVPRFGLVLCAALLASFTAVLALLLPQLRGADCHCFGAVSSSVVDLHLIARNVALGAVAAGVATLAWTHSDPGSVPVLEFAMVAFGAVLAVIVRTYRALPTLDDVGALTTTEEVR